jgi:hypothetical protein
MVQNDLRGFEFSLTAKGQKQCISLIKFFDHIETNSDKKYSAQRLRDFIEVSRNI